MHLFPAIDLMDGKVVRLYQGDYKQSQVFGDEPSAFAQRFKEEGAQYLHLVDLDGAKAGSPQNFTVVEQIAREGGLFIELGGGIRNEEAIKRCYAAGVDRVILGTAALRDRAFTQRMLEQYGDRVAIGVDARDGHVAVEGWLETSDTDSLLFCRQMRDAGAAYIIYTDIARDGAQRGTNLAVYSELQKIDGLHITASGGVSSLGDVEALRDMGLYAAILGKALYTGAIQLEEALAVAHKED